MTSFNKLNNVYQIKVLKIYLSISQTTLTNKSNLTDPLATKEL